MSATVLKDTKPGIELVLGTILNLTRNKWISSRELSIYNLCKDASVPKHYIPFIIDTLKSIGLIESEGQRTGFKFRIVSDQIPDLKILTDKIVKESYTFYKAKRYAKNEGYPQSKSSDLKPLKKKTSRDLFNTSSSVVYPDRKHVNIDDVVYFMHNNRLTQALVVGIKRHADLVSATPTKKFTYTLRFLLTRNTQDSDANTVNSQLSEIEASSKEVFSSIEDLLYNIERSGIYLPNNLLKCYKK